MNATSIGVQLNGSPESGTEPLVSVSDSYTQAIIPEPGTYGLLGAGLLSLAILGRRKR